MTFMTTLLLFRSRKMVSRSRQSQLVSSSWHHGIQNCWIHWICQSFGNFFHFKNGEKTHLLSAPFQLVTTEVSKVAEKDNKGLSSASKIRKFHQTGLQLTINAHSKSPVWRTCLKLWLECGRLETTETEIFEPFKPNLNFFFQNAEPNQNKPHHDQPWA